MGNDLIPFEGAELPVDILGTDTGMEGWDDGFASVFNKYLKIAQDKTSALKGERKLAGLEPGMFFCESDGKVFGPTIRVAMLHAQWLAYEYTGKYPNKKYGEILPFSYFEAHLRDQTQRDGPDYYIPGGSSYEERKEFAVFPLDAPSVGPMIFTLGGMNLRSAGKWAASAKALRVKDKEGNLVPVKIWLPIWELSTSLAEGKNGESYIFSAKALGWAPATTWTMLDEARQYATDRWDDFIADFQSKHATVNVTGSAATAAVASVFGENAKDTF